MLLVPVVLFKRKFLSVIGIFITDQLEHFKVFNPIVVDEQGTFFLNDQDFEAELEVNRFTDRVGFVVKDDFAVGFGNTHTGDRCVSEPVDDVLAGLGGAYSLFDRSGFGFDCVAGMV